MMIVEDKTFDFLVRDRLKKECEERHLLPLSGDPRNHDQLSLDMITYCSRGNKEEAVRNLKATKDFMDGYRFVSYIGIGDCVEDEIQKSRRHFTSSWRLGLKTIGWEEE